jgi:hypothetical protein
MSSRYGKPWKHSLPDKIEFEENCKRMRWFELEKKYGVNWSVLKYWKRIYGLTDGVKHDRFVDIVDRDGCWECVSHKANKGYPRGKGGALIVVRLWEEKNGKWPEKKLVRHLCDRGWCVNPDHVVPGTQFENIVDTVLDGKGKTQKNYIDSLLANAFERGVISLDVRGFVIRVVDKKRFPIKGTVSVEVRRIVKGNFTRVSGEKLDVSA